MQTETEIKKLRNEINDLKRQTSDLQKKVEHLLKLQNKHFPNDPKPPVF